MVDKYLRHYEVGNYDGDNHGVVLVDEVNTLKSLSVKVIASRLHGDGVST